MKHGITSIALSAAAAGARAAAIGLSGYAGRQSANNAAGNASAPDDVRALKVRGNIYMVVGAGANITVQVGDDGVLLVDSGTATMNAKVLSVVRQLSTKPI